MRSWVGVWVGVCVWGGRAAPGKAGRAGTGRGEMPTCRELHARPAVLGEHLLVQAQQALSICQAPHFEVAVGCMDRQQARGR